ncbi:MAG: putative S-layer protein [Candidatus Pacearchaeota archaeon]|jgi:hypothetical protein
MKAKNLTLISLSILISLVLMTLASATLTISSLDYPTSVDDIEGSFIFTFNITDTSITPISVTFADSTISFGSISITDLTNEDLTTAKQITGAISNFADQGGNTMTITIVANETEDPTNLDSETFSVNINLTIPSEVTECESTGNPGSDLRIKEIEFTNKGMKIGDTTKEFGDDDAWFPLDDIEVEITIENNGNDDIDNIEVNWGLWDTEANDWIIELDDEKDFDLKDDDEETLAISFNLESSLDIDLEDLEDGNHYRFYVIAEGENTDIDADVCEYDYEDTEIVIEKDFVVLDNFEFPESVSCADEVQIIADTWNIGDRDQDDVYIRIYNTELGINNKIVDIGDIDAFDHEDLNTIIQIPEDAKEKIYQLNFEVYDEDDDIYETDFDNDDSSFYILLNVASCKTPAKAIVSATLESGGVAGEELVVRATIVNSGSDTTYNLNLAGFSTWADSGNFDSNTVTLGKGEQKDVLATFLVKEDASGEQTFDIEVLSDGDFVLTQPVAITIEEAPKGFLSGITGNAIGGGNTYLWIIGALNVILVVIIIIVAIRVARK